MTRRPAVETVTFGVLGPMRATNSRGPITLRGQRQRAVLARLLVARGRVVPVEQLVDDLWTSPPKGAVPALRTFVSDLRRALEPDRPPRQPARLLVTAPPGYALHAAPEAVDAGRFAALVDGARRLLPAGNPEQARADLDEALALWRGPAYAEFADDGWARAEINRLEELRLLAVERRAEALLVLGRAAEAVADLRAHAERWPLREDAWHLLATALYRSGQQGAALAALRRIRANLVEQLGVDPGPRLRQLEADVLAQAAHLHPPEQPGTHDQPGAGNQPGAAGDQQPLRPVPDSPAEAPTATASSRDTPRPFVGRDDELTRLAQAAATVVTSCAPRLALVSAEAGAGKTALAEALTRRLAAEGWATAWGRGPEYEGAPVAWPWRQITEALTAPAALPADPAPVSEVGPAAETAPPVGRASPGSTTDRRHRADDRRGTPLLAGGGAGGPRGAEDPAVARFRLRRAVVSQLAAATARGPVLLVVDDLHRADEATLELLVTVAVEADPAPGPVLLVGTYRATEISPELTAALARVAATEPVRVYLGGLAEPATGELVRAVAGPAVQDSTVALVHRRSGGNPFFVRELARLLATDGGAALREVPAGVRDVIRHRLAGLPPAVRSLLAQASVLGREVDPEVLTLLVGDEAAVLDALDTALRAGFLTEQDPGGCPWFTHILVRDTLYGDLSALRRARWHAAVGTAIERLRPDDVTALAHHFVRAASRATAPRAARYAQAAAERAEARFDLREAAREWQAAAEAHDRAGADDPDGRLACAMGLGRTLAVSGRLDEARRHRSAAIATAEQLRDPVRTAEVITAFDVPAIWPRNDDEELSRQVVRAAERTLAVLGTDHPVQRARLCGVLALELRGSTDDRGRRAADEAEALARRLGDPALLAFALNARFMHTFGRAGLADERARLGAELVEVAAGGELVSFEVLGHLVALQAHCALAEFAVADRHAEAVDRLAGRYDLPLAGVFTDWYAGLRLAVAGRTAEAEAAYRAAGARLDASAMPGMSQGLLPLALLSLRLPPPSTGHTVLPGAGGTVSPGVGRAVELPVEAGLDADWGPYAPWVRPLLLVAAGRRTEATAALRALPPSPADLLREARLCLAARAALALDDRPTMAQLRAALRPAAGELAGAGSGVLSLGPVAAHLDALAAALDRPDAAPV